MDKEQISTLSKHAMGPNNNRRHITVILKKNTANAGEGRKAFYQAEDAGNTSES